MKRPLLLLFVLVGLAYVAVGQADADAGSRTVPYTLADRDRIVRLEAQLESFAAESNRRFEELHTSLQDTRSDIKDFAASARDTTLWMGGILGALIVALFGFIVYDRREASRLAYQPLTEEIRRLQHEVEQLKAHLPQKAA